MAHENRFDFGGAEPLPGNFDRVVRATKNVPEAILIDRSPIAVDPDVGESAPVSLNIAIRIFPEAARHADPGFSYDEFAHLPADGLPFLIHDIGSDARNRSRESAGLKRRKNVPRDQTT